MSLKPFHIVLISTAIALGIALGAWGFYHRGAEGASLALHVAWGSIAVALAFSLYLLWFLHRMKQKGW